MFVLGSTMTTFDGAGVRFGVTTLPPPPPPPLPPPPPDPEPPGSGIVPVKTASVSRATTASPTAARIGAASVPAGPIPYGSLVGRAPGSARTGRRGGSPDASRGDRRLAARRHRRRGGRHARPRRRRGSRAGSTRSRRSARVTIRATTSSRSPSGDRLGQVGSAERDPVDDVEPLAQRELGMAAIGGADTGHGEALDGDERVGVPRTGRIEPTELGEEPVVDLGRRHDQVDPELGASIGRGRQAVRDEREEPLPERRPSARPRARTRRRRDGRRDG